MPLPRVAVLVSALTCIAPAAAADGILDGLDRLYNFDFGGARRVLDRYVQAHPADPLGSAFRAAVLLFSEADRLAMLESKLFLDDRRFAQVRRLRPNPEVQQNFLVKINETRAGVARILASDPRNANALFASAVAGGLAADWTWLIDRKYWPALSPARESHRHALELLRYYPDFHDAYVTTGFNEYLSGSLPFFLRWFVRFEQVQGNKSTAIERLELAAKSGRYLGPFARILLAVIHLRERRPQETRALLVGLSRDFPENELFKRELERLSGNGAGGSR
jgi:hypothetical protein